MSENYNCPNCGAPIGYTEKCDYCGTRIEWRPYVIHLAPKLYYHKTHDASVIGMVKKGAWGQRIRLPWNWHRENYLKGLRIRCGKT